MSDADALALAHAALGRTVAAIERLPVGFGSENWRLSTDDGAFILKVGPLSSASKWASARQAHDLAADMGVPVPQLAYFSLHREGVVRVFRWVDGQPLASILDRPELVHRFTGDLARAVAALHGVEQTSFSSRLDGSAPSFTRWSAYVRHRLGQIRQRAVAVEALDHQLLDRVDTVASGLADRVSPVVRATLCHRDLHPDNLVVGADGRLAAILDWDMSESWDPAGEWFKLDWMLLPLVGEHTKNFDAAYQAVHPARPLWAERKRLVEILESANAVANATIEHWTTFGEAAHERLLAALDDRPRP